MGRMNWDRVRRENRMRRRGHAVIEKTNNFNYTQPHYKKEEDKPMGNITLVEALKLAAEGCPALFTFDQLFSTLQELDPEVYTKQKEMSARRTLTQLVSSGVWKKVGTTNGWLVSVYCTDPEAVEITVKNEPVINPVKSKTIKVIDVDTPTKDVVKMLDAYINERIGNTKYLSDEVYKLQDSIRTLREEHAEELAKLNSEWEIKEAGWKKRYKAILENQLETLK